MPFAIKLILIVGENKDDIAFGCASGGVGCERTIRDSQCSQRKSEGDQSVSLRRWFRVFVLSVNSIIHSANFCASSGPSVM